MPKYNECSIYDASCRTGMCRHRLGADYTKDTIVEDYFTRLWPSKDAKTLTAMEMITNISMLSPDDGIVFVTPDGKKFRAHNVIKPGGGRELLVSLIEEPDETDEPGKKTPAWGPWGPEGRQGS